MGLQRVGHDWATSLSLRKLRSRVPHLWNSVVAPGLPVAQVVKNLPTMWEMCVQSMNREDPLEEEMATHSTSILAWRIPRTEEPGGLQSTGSQRGGHDCMTFISLGYQQVQKGGNSKQKNFRGTYLYLILCSQQPTCKLIFIWWFGNKCWVFSKFFLSI